MSGIVSGLIGGAIATVFVIAAERTQRAAKIGSDGWKRLRAGWLLNATFIGCAALSLLMGYILFSGGSSRPDADTQNIYIVILALASAIMALYVGWSAYGRVVMWNKGSIRVRDIFGRERTYSLPHARSVRKGESSGEYKIIFDDGSRLRFSAYLHGAAELVTDISHRQTKR